MRISNEHTTLECLCGCVDFTIHKGDNFGRKGETIYICVGCGSPRNLDEINRLPCNKLTEDL